MLEYFTYKKVKKHQAEKERSKTPVLSPVDEQFLQRIVAEDGAPSATSARQRPNEAGDPTGNQAQLVVHGDGPDAARSTGHGHEDDVARGSSQVRNNDSKKATNRWSFLERFAPKKNTSGGAEGHSKTDAVVTPKEAAKEEEDITIILDKLNLAAENNKVFSLSKESRELVHKFTLILKDLVNGVPTAYDDLVHLLDSSQGQLEKSYTRLPPYLQKLIRSLPKKLTTSLAPELLATAAEAQGASGKQAGVAASAAKKAGMRMPSLKDMVTKPGAVAGILRAIMNFLKLRWPAFMGTSVLWSLGIFVLLLVFWYCHKRGREVRLLKEKKTSEELNDANRFEELDDDYTTDGASSVASAARPEQSHHARGSSNRMSEA